MMFFVFGPQGQMYRGGPENLAHITAVRRVEHPQALGTLGTEVGSPPVRPSVRPSVRPASASGPSAAAAPRNPRAQDAVSAYAQTEQGPQVARQPLTRVSDVMTTAALSIQPDMLAHEAWKILAEHHVAQSPVVDALGRVIGLLLRADLAPLDLLPGPAAIQQTIDRARRPVSEVMVSPVPTVAADTELRRVAAVLLDTGLPGLPVTDEVGLLAGFITRADILRAVAGDPPLDLWSGHATPL